MATATVLLFGPLAEARGTRVLEVDVAPGETLASLYARLFEPPRIPVGFARNAIHCDPEAPVEDGDEVAFLPPVGGG